MEWRPTRPRAKMNTSRTVAKADNGGMRSAFGLAEFLLHGLDSGVAGTPNVPLFVAVHRDGGASAWFTCSLGNLAVAPLVCPPFKGCRDSHNDCQ
jgi:hypothetical protein